MRANTLLFLLFGIAGCGVLVALGLWQVQRMAWKEDILNRIESRIAAEPTDLPERPEPAADKYLPVTATGSFGGGVLRVLVSRKQVGAGYLLISPFEAGGRTILVDRGFIATDAAIPAPPPGRVTVTGNLHWPDDRTGATPGNDVAGNIWFARDIPAMADVFGAEPVLLIARTMSQPDPNVTPLPVDTGAIPNDHLEYAITWFSLAAIWAAMTGFFLRRARTSAKGRPA